MIAIDSTVQSDAIMALSTTGPVRRLESVSFLGAIEKLDPKSNGSGSRLDHTIGVTMIALNIAKQLRYSRKEQTFCLFVAMLHDVGHTIFSHSGEKILKRRFGVDHHDMIVSIMENSDELKDVSERFGCDFNDLIRYFSGDMDPNFGFCRYIFDSRINPDTIEGITRAATYFGEGLNYDLLDDLIPFVANPDRRTQSAADYFWMLKHKVYEKYIYSRRYADLDEKLELMSRNIELEIDDLYKWKESDFLSLCENESVDSELALSSEKLEQHKREFRVNRQVSVSSPEDVRFRYLIFEGCHNEVHGVPKHK